MTDPFVTNRQAAFDGLMKNPDHFVAGHAEALGIPYAAAAKLVAYGMATMIKAISEQKPEPKQHELPLETK